MADEYINRTEALKDFDVCNADNPKWTPARVKALLIRQPAVGAAPVVYCRDCRYFGRELENGKHDCTDFNLPYCRSDDFCSHGVQKEATSTDE